MSGNLDTSCRNCKFLETLSPRVNNFGFQCELPSVRTGLILGGGRSETVIADEEGKILAFPRLRLTAPQDVSCNSFTIKP